MILQTGGAVPSSAVELVLTASTETKIVLVITAVFSLVSWFIIVFKWWQFRKLNKQADRFFAEMERTTRLQDAYHAVMKQPPSPYNRLFREAITFYSELRPGALREERGADRSAITPTQLEALKMVLGKEVAAERDLLGHYIPWLATIGSVSPLLGLLGTTLGIINAFTGIATKGSGNLAAVAPGVAEALVATFAGLAAAIPAVIAYNLYVNRREGTLDLRFMPLNADVNVTSLVDVMLVLLIIFMITAPMMQGGVDVELPRAEARPLSPKEGMVVTVNRDGRIFVDQTPVSYNDFRVTFRSLVATRKPQGVYLQADTRVPYGQVVRVLAIIRGAGAATSSTA